MTPTASDNQMSTVNPANPANRRQSWKARMPESTCSARRSAIPRTRAGIGMRSRTFSSSRPVCGRIAMAAPPAAARTTSVRARSSIQRGFGFTPTSKRTPQHQRDDVHQPLAQGGRQHIGPGQVGAAADEEAADHFPGAGWKQIVAQVARVIGPEHGSHGEPAGGIQQDAPLQSAQEQGKATGGGARPPASSRRVR